MCRKNVSFKICVIVIPKEGFMGGALPIHCQIQFVNAVDYRSIVGDRVSYQRNASFGMTTTKIFKDLFFTAHTSYGRGTHYRKIDTFASGKVYVTSHTYIKRSLASNHTNGYVPSSTYIDRLVSYGHGTHGRKNRRVFICQKICDQLHIYHWSSI